MSTPETNRPRGLRLHDLIGLVVGYGMAALLVRSFWPRSRPLEGIPAIVLGFEVLWLGLAMSGPIVLLLDRRASSSPTLRPKRPGRLISSREPIGRRSANPQAIEPSVYTRAELAWMVIGGYWIGLTMFVVPALHLDTPWALIGLLQVVAAVGLWLVVPKRTKPGTGGEPLDPLRGPWPALVLAGRLDVLDPPQSELLMIEGGETLNPGTFTSSEPDPATRI